MKLTEWVEAVTYLNLKWPGRPLDQDIARAWFTGVARYQQMDVMAAMDRLSWRLAFRPSLAELVNETRALLREHEPHHRTEPRPVRTAYAAAWYLAGIAVQEGRLVRADLERLTKQHQAWFLEHGRDAIATADMIAEVDALVAIAIAPAASEAELRRPRGGYSDAHKARYIANADAYFARRDKERMNAEPSPA